MLYTGKSILDVANAHSFAIPAFNISDWAMFTGIMDISEEKNAPVIIAIHPDEVSHITTDLIPAMHARAHRSSVPVAIHWDHGGTYEQIITAIQAGFTSVMIDASLEPFEQNVALTRKVVEAAHAVGVQVEGELGTIGANDSYGESGAAEIIYTNVDDAVRFVEQTGVDSLAIAIGTSHGLYPSDKNPELRHDLLEQIKAAVGIPLVLHGGSSNPDAELARAVSLGINKINISSDIKVAYHDRMREVLGTDRRLREPNAIQPEPIAAMKVTAAEKIDLFGAAGKADLY
ncbi:ketose-bisphosphate aldolase [Microbacterium sp. NPDC089180]|uniref:Ketose-bisphosphate aldolase n=3 Tax=Microbacterium TaxID=33882 RepID=A0ABU3SJ83_9MICO|nr:MULTISPECIES: ketose-bisphosphate aldolase [unclassified Microbacterium]MDU0344845.1 ketose-bisphosphate aldolase [Microbacterium sp. KSW2-29]MDU0366489.1 ketose-bisphosphate aldolase [Microbacterium sp. KSW4-17]SDO43029.1 fructose-bisphosphate aldolase, class II [Microbacterium sp. ru370.1]SIT80452.1 fructose-bisphosphate aldolase, class II [Microbacterium sp. RU1D]